MDYFTTIGTVGHIESTIGTSSVSYDVQFAGFDPILKMRVPPATRSAWSINGLSSGFPLKVMDWM